MKINRAFYLSIGRALIPLATSGVATAQAIPKMDFGCLALSYSSSNKQLLVTDRAGRVFIGDLENPLQTRIESTGNVNQARFIAGGGKILLAYQSGAIEVVDAKHPESVVESLPPYTYMDLKVSRDGLWAIGLPPGGIRVDILALDAGHLRRAYSYEHPLGASMRLGEISSAQGLAALIDEQGAIQLLDLANKRPLRISPPLLTKNAQSVRFLDDHLWITEDAGLMPLGTAYPLPGREKKEVTGVPMARSATLIQIGESDIFVSSDDLGFAQIVKRRASRDKFEFENIGALRLVPSLVEAVGDASGGTLALCGSYLESTTLNGTGLTRREHSRPQKTVYVESMGENGQAVVRDLRGRSALWDNTHARFIAALPRLPLQVFPAFSMLHPRTQAFLSQGQRDALSISRIRTKLRDIGATDGYETQTIALPMSAGNEPPWATSIVPGRMSQNEAYMIRPRAIKRLTWNDEASAIPQLERFIDEDFKSCSSFSAPAAVSPNGRYLAVTCEEGIAIFHLVQKRLVTLIVPSAWKERSERVRVWVSSLAFSGDDSAIAFGVRTQHLFVDLAVDQASAANRASVQLYEIDKRKLTELPSADAIPITAIALSLDGKYIWSGGYWGDLKLLSRATGAIVHRVRGIHGHVLGIKPDQAGGAHVWTDFGTLGYVSGGPSFQLITNSAFSPGALVRREGAKGASSGEDVSDISVIGVRPSDFFTQSDTASELQIDLIVPERHNNPAQVLLYEEGEVVSRGKILPGKPSNRLTVAFVVPSRLTGEISLNLYSAQGGASHPVHVGNATGDASQASGKLVGAFVGIGAYDSPELSPLPLAAGDAKALADALQSGSNSLHVFPSEKIPNKLAILSFLRQIRDTAGPSDTFVLHLSGHGLPPTRAQNFVFATSDTRPEETSGQTGITSLELVELIEKGRQGATLLILDTCNSGAFVDGIISDPRMQEGALSFGFDGRSLTDTVSVVAAAPSISVAKEGYKGRGLLTAVMIEGLERLSKSSKTGSVTHEQLLQYVDGRLGSLSRSAFPTQKQEPILRYATKDFALRGELPQP